jgi:hypothetical protein
MKDTGGPAFPTTKANYDNYLGDVGITLRDYFAAKAMHSLMHTQYVDNLAHEAYMIADAMLAERSKK